jgi:hypothetical protein
MGDNRETTESPAPLGNSGSDGNERLGRQCPDLRCGCNKAERFIMKKISKRLEKLDGLLEDMKNEIKQIDEENHFDNRPDVFAAISQIGIDIDIARRIIYQNLGD